jgi:hypothetical protein
MSIKSILSKPTRMYKLYKAAKENCFVPPGHFYSPDVNVKEVKKDENRIWDNSKEIQGVNLNSSEQINLIKEFEQYYNDIPFSDEEKDTLRYYFKNTYYSYSDAIMLYSFIRHYQPQNIIEIGSGFSSAVMLDTKDIFKLDTTITFIEPYPIRLKSLLTAQDKNSYKIIETGVQAVPLDEYRKLTKGDILFIDSTHVSKTGSDVNHIIFEILPILQSGVLVHFHDVFSSFEYPKNWVYEGRSWNEDYILRAFLMNNNSYSIKMFTHYLHTHHKESFKNMPLCYKNFGANIWIEKN